MTAGVNLLKLFDGDLRVNRRGVKVRMAEQLLDEADVRPVLQHVRGAGVAERMTAALAWHARLLQPA